MGKGDRRRSQKMLNKKSQAKLKARIKRRAEERKARIATAGKAEKKTRTRRTPAAPSAS